MGVSVGVELIVSVEVELIDCVLESVPVGEFDTVEVAVGVPVGDSVDVGVPEGEFDTVEVAVGVPDAVEETVDVGVTVGSDVNVGNTATGYAETVATGAESAT